MDVHEQAYRSVDRDHPKYLPIALAYIRTLKDAGKLLEARYCMERLVAVKPKNAQVIRLGYELAIKTFDRAGIRKYHAALYDSRPKRSELVKFQLMYLFSMNQRAPCIDAALELLKYDISDEELHLVVEVIFRYPCYETASAFVFFLKGRKLQATGLVVKKIKDICMQRMVTIIGARHA